MRSPKLSFALVAAAGIVYSLTAHAVGTRHFVLEQGEDFEGGDLEGVAVDSGGGVRAGFTLTNTPISEGSTLWAVLLERDGSTLIGTGNEGKILRVRGGTSRVVAETKSMAVTSLVEVWGGAVAAGTLPEGKVMLLQQDKLSTLVELKGADHVWQLAFDKKGGALYAATGPEGKLFRIQRDGTAQVYFDAEEQHLRSLALAPDGTVYAGSSDKAKLYKITAPGRASVLYDFERTEVRAIAVDSKGQIFAVANQFKTPVTAPKRPKKEDAATPSTETKTPSKGKGVLYRISPDGTPDRLLEKDDDYFTSLALADDGQPYAGTGLEGEVYTVDQSHNSVLVAEVAERQVTALVLSGNHKLVAASDPAVLHPVTGVGGPDAVWTSKVLDAGIRARFGRIEWQSAGRLDLSTRSGNTKEPDDSWSPWSRALQGPAKVESPAARYLQVRARFARDPAAVLTDLDVAFVTDNLRAVIREVKVGGTDTSSSKDSVEASGGPVTGKPDANLKLSWKVDNPDKDDLRYRLSYQLVGSDTWYELTRPDERLTKDSHTWDTSDLPEGRYRLRLTATDELSNPPDRTTTDSMDSGIVLVDNTPPTVEGLRLDGKRLRAVVLDGVGPIARVEVSRAGSDDFRPVFPKDGIFDEQREEIDVDLSGVLPAGPALIALRVYDAANNFVVRSLAVK